MISVNLTVMNLALHKGRADSLCRRPWIKQGEVGGSNSGANGQKDAIASCGLGGPLCDLGWNHHSDLFWLDQNIFSSFRSSSVGTEPSSLTRRSILSSSVGTIIID